MSGIIFNKSSLDDLGGSILDQVKKNDELKKRKNLKLISMIILSNLFVAYLFYSPQKENISPKQASVKILHSGYKMMVLNISPLLQFDAKAAETKITLLNNRKKIILLLGYLHEEIKNDQDPGIQRFKIEIPEEQTLEIGSLSEEKMVAIPAIDAPKTKQNNKGSTYEVSI